MSDNGMKAFTDALFAWCIEHAQSSGLGLEALRTGSFAVLALSAPAAGLIEGLHVREVPAWVNGGMPCPGRGQWLVPTGHGMTDGWAAVTVVSRPGEFVHMPRWLRVPPSEAWPAWAALRESRVITSALDVYEAFLTRSPLPIDVRQTSSDAIRIPELLANAAFDDPVAALATVHVLAMDGMSPQDAFSAARLL